MLYRSYLYEAVWGDEDAAETTRTLDTHIQRLRRKLGWADKIRTVHGVGYALRGVCAAGGGKGGVRNGE